MNRTVDRSAVEQAARSFPVVPGATVLHVHVDAGSNFLIGGREASAEQLWTNIVSRLDLPEGQPLVVVGCGVAAPAAAFELAVAELARQAGRWVLAADADIHASARGLLARAGLDPAGRPATGPGHVLLMAPDGQVRDQLGPDLAAAIADPRLTGTPKRPARAIRWADGVEA